MFLHLLPKISTILILKILRIFCLWAFCKILVVVHDIDGSKDFLQYSQWATQQLEAEKCKAEQEESHRRRGGSIVGDGGVKDTRRTRTWPTESTEQGSLRPTETEATLCGSDLSPLRRPHSSVARCSFLTPTSGNGGCLWLFCLHLEPISSNYCCLLPP